RAAGAVGARAPREPGGPCPQLLRRSPRGRCAVPARLTSVLDALQALEAVLGVGESQICVPDGVLALLASVQEALHGHGVGLLGHKHAWDVDSQVEQTIRRPTGEALYG